VLLLYAVCFGCLLLVLLAWHGSGWVMWWGMLLLLHEATNTSRPPTSCQCPKSMLIDDPGMNAVSPTFCRMCLCCCCMLSALAVCCWCCLHGTAAGGLCGGACMTLLYDGDKPCCAICFN
jgi:hypothetical protein